MRSPAKSCGANHLCRSVFTQPGSTGRNTRSEYFTSAVPSNLLQNSEIAGRLVFAKIRNGKPSLIRPASIALPRSPVSLTRSDEVPHIFTRKPRPQPSEFLDPSAKRLLQDNLPRGDICPQQKSTRYSITPSAISKQRGVAQSSALGQRRSARTRDRAICDDDDRYRANLVRTAPLLRADMILGKDECG